MEVSIQRHCGATDSSDHSVGSLFTGFVLANKFLCSRFRGALLCNLNDSKSRVDISPARHDLDGQLDVRRCR